MSNRRAAAAVTAALSELVRDAIAGVVPMATVTNRRPGVAVNDVTKPGVNVYLYRAEPNASLRNLVDPVRAGNGRLTRCPVAAWNLHYLLTCIGDEEQLEPDLLLGATVTGLTGTAVLANGFVASVDAMLASETNNRRFAAGSLLDEQTELVRLTPIEMSLDALTQLWSSLTRESYVLSVAYQASVLLMSTELSPSVPLPVGSNASIGLTSMNAPRITRVTDGQGPTNAILIGSTLVIEGENLAADHLQVRIGSLDVDVARRAASSQRIEIALSPPDGTGRPRPRDLAPGAVGVQVRHLIDISADPTAPALRPGVTSNVAPIVLRPSIIAAPSVVAGAGGPDSIRVRIAPEPKEDWDFHLLLNELNVAEPHALMLNLSAIEADGALLFDASEVPSGVWLVRAQINGAESPLLRDANGYFASPKVTVP